MIPKPIYKQEGLKFLVCLYRKEKEE